MIQTSYYLSGLFTDAKWTPVRRSRILAALGRVPGKDFSDRQKSRGIRVPDQRLWETAAIGAAQYNQS